MNGMTAMKITEAFKNGPLLMEGALGERLKREFGFFPDENIALAAHVYNASARDALQNIWIEYAEISARYAFPLMITTPTRRANSERTANSVFGESVIADNMSFARDVQKNAARQSICWRAYRL